MNKRQCKTCAHFARKPGSNHIGACFDRRVLNVRVAASSWDWAAYGETTEWKACGNWTPRGAAVEYPSVDAPSDLPASVPCDRCGDLTTERPRMTVDGRNVTLCKPCFNWTMQCAFGRPVDAEEVA